MSIQSELKVPTVQFDLTAIIDQGCEFEGKLCFRGTVRIGGIFNGQVITPDTLIISEGARVRGEIDAGVVVLSGDFEGVIRAKHRVELHSPAVFRGDLFAPSLKIDEGVIFEGSSSMTQATM